MTTPNAPLRDRCLSTALEIIAQTGVSQLSLREVARRLGVSHQAPYKHFSSRDHLLAEVVGNSYDALADRLRGRIVDSDPRADLGSIGSEYLRFASENGLQYQLMFEFPLTQLVGYEGLEAKAASAFNIVLSAISRMTQSNDPDFDRECALFAWSSVHGLASLTAGQVLPSLGLFEGEKQREATMNSMAMICRAIEARAHDHQSSKVT